MDIVLNDDFEDENLTLLYCILPVYCMSVSVLYFLLVLHLIRLLILITSDLVSEKFSGEYLLGVPLHG